MLSKEEIKAIGQEIVQPIVQQLRVEFATIIEESINPQIDQLDQKIGSVKEAMVTQSIFYTRTDDLQRCIEDMSEDTNKKIVAHVDLTREKGVITKDEAGKILTMPPFAQHHA